MPFFAILAAAAVMLPLVMLLTNVRAEIIVVICGAIIGALVLHRLRIAELVDGIGWLLTILSFIPGLAPARWMRKRRVKVQVR